MKYCLTLTFVLLIVTANVQAVTTFQTWDDSAGWTQVDQAGSVINVRPNGAAYVTATPFQRNSAAGYAGLQQSIGTLIPAGTTGGNMPECWMQYDFRYDSGSTRSIAFFGLYNTSGSNANGSTIELIGVVMNGRTLQAVGKNTGVTVPGTMPVIERVKMHIYNQDSNSLMDVEVYAYDLATNTTTLAGSLNGYLVLSSGQSLTYGCDVFGLRNVAGGVYSANFTFDNMYFSNETPNESVVPAPFGMTCTNTTGDFTEDCKVNIDDLLVVCAEWLDCATIPTRLCAQ